MSRDILVVDDSATIRKVITKAIRMIGLEVGNVLEAGNGMEALALLADHRVAVVLADVNMPVMTGAQLVAAMQKSESLKDIPVVIVSTDGSHRRVESLRAGGIAGYIRKPFRPEELRDVLEPFLGSSNEQDSLTTAAKDVL